MLGRALSIEVRACLSFGTTGTRPCPRWKRLPSSSFLSWWVLALSCWCKVGGDKRVRQKIDLARRRQTGCLDQRRRSVFGKSMAPARLRCPYVRGNKLISFKTRWIKRNVPSLESIGILTLLSVLIVVPAFLMIRLLEPGFVLPAFSILLFSDAAIAAILARAIPLAELRKV